MKKLLKHLVLGIIICMLISTAVFIFLTNRQSPEYVYNFKEQVSTNQLMTVDEMKADLDYVVNTLKDVHPKAYNGFTEEQNMIIERAYGKIKKPMKAGEFYFILNEVICSLKDAHTMIWLEAAEGDRVIDLPIVWLNDGMYIEDDRDTLKKGDKVLSIGGKTEQDLLEELTKIIPAENKQWVKVMGKSNITNEPYLSFLGLIEDDYVNVRIQRSGKEFNLKLPLVKHEESEKKASEDWVSYTIDGENSLGVFRLDTCINNEKYRMTLENFFEEVAKNNIKNIAVDVRRNTGGNSMVIDEFIKYIEVDEYFTYTGDIRYSKQASEQRGYFRKWGYKSYTNKIKSNKKVSDKNLIFDGKIYVLTSPNTFSSGNWFAVIVRDNSIGKIIGEPTGNQPSSYGDVLKFQTPNTGFIFQVSYKKWVRPITDNDPEDSLYPDVEVYTTIEDIIYGRDPQIQKLIQIVKE